MGYAGRQATAQLAEALGVHNAIIREVCAEYGVTESELKSRFRHRRIAWPRQEAYRRLQEQCKFSTPQIARLFNRDNHTTVLKGIKRARERQVGY